MADAYEVLREIATAVEEARDEVGSIGTIQLALFLREEAERYRPQTVREAFLSATFPDGVPVEFKR